MIKQHNSLNVQNTRTTDSDKETRIGKLEYLKQVVRQQYNMTKCSKNEKGARPAATALRVLPGVAGV